jgi:dTDP-4-dehydrorhamnose 3,5-epimerase-like enzyme
MRKPVRIILLEDTGDHRGGSFAIPGPCLEFLDSVRDVHIASMRPGEVRGNHYHRDRREILCVVYTGQWSFH